MKFYTNVVQYGNQILYTGVSNGTPVSFRKDFHPQLFIKSQKNSKYKSMYGVNLEPIDFSDINDAKDYVKQYSEIENFEIFGNTNYAYQYISREFPDEVDYTLKDIKIYTIDIETTADNGFPDALNPIEEIILISLQNYHTKEIHSFGCRDFTPTRPNHNYIQCANETQLLTRFVDFISSLDLNVLTGWNIEIFDIPYIINRYKKLIGEKSVRRLSPWGIIKERSFEKFGKQTITFEIVGIAILDYLELYKKFTYSVQESYKLNYIAKVELGEEKVEYDEYESFREFYRNNWPKFVEYNVVDIELVDKLEQKMKLIELIITMAYDAKCNYNDVFSAVRIWDCTLYNHCLKKNIIVHQKAQANFRNIVGAYVQEPIPGMYDWVISFDATSLYPSIIMQYNMSPETLFENDQKDVTVGSLLKSENDLSDLYQKNLCMAANGFMYTKEKQGIFPEIVQKLFDDRQRYKKKMLEVQQKYEETHDEKYKADISKFNNFQMARKIQLNSLFGAMANEWFRFYDDRIAEGITITGQYIIQEVGREINQYLNKICETEGYNYSFYSDTDSCYVSLKPLVDKFFKKKSKEEIVALLDKVCEDKIVKVINKACKRLFDYTNGFEEKIFFKRESISDKGIWVAKKRYALNVFNNEGVQYAEPKLKVMGLEIVRSSTPEPARNILKESVKLILTQTEAMLQSYIATMEEEFHKLKAKEIAFPRGVNGVNKYTDNNNIYSSGTPMHVRGSLLYNHYLKVHSIEKKYEKIQEGEKIKFIYLKTPNPIRENCISFISDIPVEFGLTSFVDYNTMFEKTIIEPLNTILKEIGWSPRPRASLESLFG
jgi:DNA polymerase elongation subunit (family B)